MSLPKDKSGITNVPKHLVIYITVILSVAGLLAACSSQTVTPTINPSPIETTLSPDLNPQDDPTPPAITPIPQEARQLVICTGAEPVSLFPYGNQSTTARSILQALYDGPIDRVGHQLVPSIIEQIPLLDNGGAIFEPVLVYPGDAIVDNLGNLASLREGISIHPSGCTSPGCAQVFSGQEPILMDSLVVRFVLLPDLRWSDGEPLTAEDSRYAFQVAQTLYPAYRPQLVSITRSYQVIDQRTIEWRGLPGNQNPAYAEHFFAPLPQHAWQDLPASELPDSTLSSQNPLGWGAYVLDEWIPALQITLNKNPYYYRADQGLPHFDQLVFRFTKNPQAAVQALREGECQLADEAALRGIVAQDLLVLQGTQGITTLVESGGAWEQILLGINSLDPTRLPVFASPQVRQAISSCIDRQRISDEVFAGLVVAADGFVQPGHPYYTSEAAPLAFNPQAASTALSAVGWLDLDDNPTTPRVASGIAGVPDGTPFEFTYLVSDEPERQQMARIVQESLALCGIQVNLEFTAASQVYSGGPQGPVFGRQFDAAQLAWIAYYELPCSLFTSLEIPGPYPDFAKGWGGANASGYSNPNFDRICAASQSTLKTTPDFVEAYRQIQLILSEELPAIPLFLHFRAAAIQADLCGFQLNPTGSNSLWNLELLDIGDTCTP